MVADQKTEYTLRWEAVEEAKEELESLKLIEGSITSRMTRIERLKEQCLRLARWPTNSRVQGGNGEDPLIRLMDLEKEANAEIDRKVDMQREITRRIYNVPDLLLSEILIERYIDQLDWFRIALNVKYGPDHCRTDLHLMAVEEYARLNPERINFHTIPT